MAKSKKSKSRPRRLTSLAAFFRKLWSKPLLLDRFSESDKNLLLTHVRNWGFVGIQAFDPGYVDAIADAKFSVEVRASPDPAFSYQIGVNVFPARRYGTIIHGVQALFLCKP